MQRKNGFIYGLDLSLSNSGVAICDDISKKFVHISSISTNSKDNYPDRLKTIADAIQELSGKYPPKIVVFESGFYRYPKSTQALYRVQGAVMYILSDYDQLFYPPSTIKKVVCGKGNASKELVQKSVLRQFPNLEFENMDQSDAVAVVITYLKEDGNG